MKKQLVSAVAILLLVPALAFAHGGRKHATLMGTVNAITASRIDLTTKDGQKVSVPIAKNTMFMRGNSTAAPSDVKAGSRVVITLGEDNKTASHVKLGAARKK